MQNKNGKNKRKLFEHKLKVLNSDFDHEIGVEEMRTYKKSIFLFNNENSSVCPSKKHLRKQLIE